MYPETGSGYLYPETGPGLCISSNRVRVVYIQKQGQGCVYPETGLLSGSSFSFNLSNLFGYKLEIQNIFFINYSTLIKKYLIENIQDFKFTFT